MKALCIISLHIPKYLYLLFYISSISMANRAAITFNKHKTPIMLI